MKKEYNFWGAKNADVKAINTEYNGINTAIDLYEALSEIWCKETCAPRMQADWCKENMTLGQCSITAFLAQDIFGGKVYGVPTSNGNYHCFNDVNGSRFDLTSEQFDYGKEVKTELDYVNVTEQFRDVHFQKLEKKERYEHLKKLLKNYCG